MNQIHSHLVEEYLMYRKVDIFGIADWTTENNSSFKILALGDGNIR